MIDEKGDAIIADKIVIKNLLKKRVYLSQFEDIIPKDVRGDPECYFLTNFDDDRRNFNCIILSGKEYDKYRICLPRNGLKIRAGEKITLNVSYNVKAVFKVMPKNIHAFKYCHAIPDYKIDGQRLDNIYKKVAYEVNKPANESYCIHPVVGVNKRISGIRLDSNEISKPFCFSQEFRLKKDYLERDMVLFYKNTPRLLEARKLLERGSALLKDNNELTVMLIRAFPFYNPINIYFS